ncbi:Mu-like prophage protein gpG [Moraxella lacunata]|uniref:Mu-like prophage protein gpG n=1 Tax=Moraxella lacunata TaxID=477 RepID=A0A378TVA3_MORLA|nr:phage virion morphogenesis protein [Moraxella lacunata]STZ63920.1 Mu-like prophage protein gpG [Moraxella lacunata]
MTQMTLNVSDDLPLLQGNVEALREKLGDLTPLMDAIGSLLESSTRQRFADKKAPDGTSWANLMPSTQTQKGNNNILVKSGDLLRSITHHADPYGISVGTPESYGVYHQFGTTQMTARPFLGLSNDDQAEIYELINEILMGD